MTNSKLFTNVLAISIAEEFGQQLAAVFQKVQDEVKSLAIGFVTGQVSAEATFAFEKNLQQQLRSLGRHLTEFAYNSIECESSGERPVRCEFDDVEFSRRRRKTPVRGGVSTLFGSVRLQRFQYEPLIEAKDQRLASISPLEIQLGIVARNATPALAERVGQLAAGHTESEVLDELRDEHDVTFSKATLRNVTRTIGEGIVQHLHDAQKDRLLGWLREASDSTVRSKPVLAVGRDGIMLPIRNTKLGETAYREGGRRNGYAHRLQPSWQTHRNRVRRLDARRVTGDDFEHDHAADHGCSDGMGRSHRGQFDSRAGSIARCEDECVAEF